MKILRTSIQRRTNGFWERENPIDILVNVAGKNQWAPKTPEIKRAVEAALQGLQTMLEPVGFGFAYRTINEVCAYVATYLECDDSSLLSNSASDAWQAALDRAIYQKVLPKLHGNRRQLGDCLGGLKAFLNGGAAKYSVGMRTIEISHEESLGFPLPLSARKVESMSLRLDSTGHTTFVS
jgi:hypothetical protein